MPTAELVREQIVSPGVWCFSGRWPGLARLSETPGRPRLAQPFPRLHFHRDLASAFFSSFSLPQSLS